MYFLHNHNFEMYEAFEKLKESDVKVYAVKTDAFHSAKKDMKKARKLVEFGSEIGQSRVEKKRVGYVQERYVWKHNENPRMPVYKNERLEVEDEWNVERICKDIVRKRNCMIRANYAGAGKSSIGKHLALMGHNVLLVVPQNMLKQEVECEAVTMNSSFGIAMSNESKMPKYDQSELDVIVFDEIFMTSPFILNKIWQFRKEHAEKIVIGAGDVKQLPSIGPYTNWQNVETYVDSCLDLIFSNDIFCNFVRE